MKWTPEEVNRITLFYNIKFLLDTSMYSSQITAEIKAMIPEMIDDIWRSMIAEFIDELRSLPKDKVQKIYQQLPPGYIRFRILDCILMPEAK